MIYLVGFFGFMYKCFGYCLVIRAGGNGVSRREVVVVVGGCGRVGKGLF